jgi:hypothetical protein
MTEKKSPNKPDRPERTPLHEQRDTINVKNADPNKVYRWVNDTTGRIEKFLRGGYEMAAGDTEFGDKVVESMVTRTSGVVERHMGQGTKAVLMCIRKDWYEEDQAAKQRDLDEVERAMKREALHDRYGKFEIERRK